MNISIIKLENHTSDVVSTSILPTIVEVEGFSVNLNLLDRFRNRLVIFSSKAVYTLALLSTAKTRMYQITVKGCVYICRGVCMWVSRCGGVGVYVCVYVCVYMCGCVYVGVYMCVYGMCRGVYVYVCVYIFIYISY